MAGLELPFGISLTNPKASVDEHYGPWSSLQAAKTNVPKAIRAIGLTVGIVVSNTILEYWWQGGVEDANLVPKTGGIRDISNEMIDALFNEQTVEQYGYLNAAGLAHYDAKMKQYTADVRLTYQIVDALPEQDIDTHCIYMILNSASVTQNIYDEWLYMKKPDQTYVWECIGSTAVDMTQYYTKAETNAQTTSAINGLRTELLPLIYAGLKQVVTFEGLTATDGMIVEYIGETTQQYKNGRFYQYSETNDEWTQVVTDDPVSVVYDNETEQLTFYNVVTI